ncbi:Nitrilase [compost metagenome]
MPDMHHIAARSYAFEGRCFVLCAGQYLSTDDIPTDLLAAYRRGVGHDAPAQGLLFKGGSGVIGPDGSWVTAPLFGEPAIVVAKIDLSQIDAHHHDLDVTGHYLRPDIFDLSVDRRVRTGLTLCDS